ncbi:MAG: hypothetical protein IV100_21575 [Myxococcales bacterium]|nr:hypothetical protein [Myxococcales bacterium]
MMRLLVLAAALSLAPGCKGRGQVTVELSFDGKVLTTCKASGLDALNPEGGGYAYRCDGGTSLYVIQDTSVSKDQSIVSINFPDGATTRHLKPAVFASTRGTIDCPSAKALARTTGEPSIPPATPGTWTLQMADPCGPVTFTVTRTP